MEEKKGGFLGGHLRAAIAETVSNEAEIDEEMRHLVAVLRRR